MSEIRASTVLPARRAPVSLHTSDGLSLAGELALPEGREPVATLICLHPLPTHGGMMDSHVYRKAAFRLPALAGIAVLRFNTRGTWSEQGTSEGSFDNAVGEQYDVAAAIEYAEFHDLPNVWLVVELGVLDGGGHVVLLPHRVVEGALAGALLAPRAARVEAEHRDARQRRQPEGRLAVHVAVHHAAVGGQRVQADEGGDRLPALR